MIRRPLAVAAAALAALLGMYASPASASIPPPTVSVWCTALPVTIGTTSYQNVGVVTDGSLYYKFWQGNSTAFPFYYVASSETTCTGDGQSTGGESLTPQSVPVGSLVCTQQGDFTDPAPPHFLYRYGGQGRGNLLGHDWFQYWRIRAAGTDLGSFDAVYYCGANAG